MACTLLTVTVRVQPGMMGAMNESLMTAGELAEHLNVSINTVYQWRQVGTGPRALRIGKYLRYRPTDVERWLESRAADTRASAS